MIGKTIISGNLPLIESKVNVSWKWNDEAQGLVEWTFANIDSSMHSVVLFRSGYYFAGAFWPVYVDNGMTSWVNRIAPLAENGTDKNSSPIAPVKFHDGHHQIMFIFTLGPNQTWSMLEGGFINNQGPTGIRLFEVTPIDTIDSEYCIGYDPKQVSDWDNQTNSSMQGYQPDPKTFKTILFEIQNGASDVRLYPGDSVKQGSC